MKSKFVSVCCCIFGIVILQCFGVDGDEDEKTTKISWSVFGGDKNKIVRLEANPAFDSALLSWLKYHEISMPPGQQSKGNS